MHNMSKRVMGIDLAIRRKSTLAVLAGKDAFILNLVELDLKDIPRFIERARPALVAIDCPLSLPNKDPWRKEEKELHSLGIPVFPLNMGSMQKLAKAGIALEKELKKRGFKVIEVYPYATRVLCKEKEWQTLRALLETANKKDEEDAIIAAFTGILFLEGKTRKLGKRLVVPNLVAP